MENFLLFLLGFVMYKLTWDLTPAWFKKFIVSIIIPPRSIPMKKPSVVTVRSKKTRVITEYKNKFGVTFKEGDRVMLSKKAFVTKDPTPPQFLGQPVTRGKIVSLFPDWAGLVIVEPRLGGYSTWNVNDLEKL